MLSKRSLRQPRYSLLGLLAALSLMVLPLAFGVSQASATPNVPEGSYVYAVSRNGDVIGQQRIDLMRDGGKLTVISDVQLDVKFLGFNLYGFRQHVEEVWQDGALLSLTSDSDDDGTPKKVSMTRQGERLVGDYNGKARDVDARLITSTFWNFEAVRQKVIMDCFKGKARDVTIEDRGETSIKLPTGQVKARHFIVEGELARELWYDADGILVSGQMVAKDGSIVRQDLLKRP
jgi:hypothetical protein